MWRRILRLALLAAGLAALGWVLATLPGAETLAGMVAADRPEGPVLFVLLGGALSALFVPRQAVAYAGGFLFGLWAGTLIGLAAQALGCVIDVLWARLVARDWVRGWLAARQDGRVARLDRFLAANTFMATLMLRMLPMGNNTALNLLAGASSVSAGAFIAGSTIGYIPQTVIFAMLGAGARMEGWVETGVGLALLVLSAGLGLLLMRRMGAPG